MSLFYKGNGRVGGRVLPMDDDAKRFLALRHKTEEARLARGGRPIQQGRQNDGS